MDETMAGLVKQRREENGEKVTGDWKIFVEDLCIERCLRDHSKGKKALGGQFTTAVTLPLAIQNYFSCAQSCHQTLLGMASGQSVPVAEVLHRCGMVHISLADDSFADLVAKLRHSLEQLRPQDIGLVDKQSPLRSGREELWLPFEEPFLQFEKVLENQQVAEAVRSFFDNKTDIVVDHVNIVNAPGGAGSARQGLHSDVAMAGEHLEIHLPLVEAAEARSALPLERGPTRFCPCTQGLTDLSDPYARSIRRYFASRQRCLEYADLSWILHSEIASEGGPWVTLYDADVFHQGLENVSPKARPVMVIALTSSLAAVHQRNYVRRNISSAHVDALVKYRSKDLRSALSF